LLGQACRAACRSAFDQSRADWGSSL
jgi:hypothetical protein